MIDILNLSIRIKIYKYLQYLSMSQEESNIMEEIEAELYRIKTSKPDRTTDKITERYCNAENVEDCLKHLQQELDYFDVSQLNEPYDLKSLSGTRNVMCDVINGAFDLIDLCKETNKEKDNIMHKNTRLQSEVRTLKKTIDNLKNEIKVKDKEIEINKEKHCLERIKNGELQSKVALANRELNIVQKENRSSIDRYKHEVRKVEETNRRLENKFRKDCGSYVSRDANTVAIIDKYKRNERVLNSTISDLKTNNQNMLEEILNLKEKLSEMNSVLHGRSDADTV